MSCIVRTLVPRVAAVCLLIVLMPPVRSSAEDKPDSSSGYDSISGSIAVEERYNDNILNYSPGDLYLLGNNVRPAKFSISRPYDFVTSIKGRVIFSGAFLRNNPTAARVRVNYSAYAANKIREYWEWGIELRQTLWRKNTISAGINLLPRYYLRNLTYRDLSLRPRDWLKTAEAKLDKRVYSVDVERDFSSRLTASLGYDYAVTTYNHELQERDNNTHRAMVEGSYRIIPALRVSCGYVFSFSRAQGREMSDSLADTSYRSHGLALAATLSLRRLMDLPFIQRTDAAFEYQEYLSDKVYDPVDRRFRYGDRYHYRRIDRFFRISNELVYKVLSGVEIFVEHSWEQTSSNLEDASDAGSYQTHQLGGGVELSF